MSECQQEKFQRNDGVIMIVKNNVDLSKKTTFHIGGIAKKYYIL